MSNQSFMIPIGFRFEPTDEELLRGFLFPKLMGLRLPWDGITDRDVYGDNAEPWNVFSDADNAYWNTKKEGGVIKKTIYVFTKVTKAASNSKRISRRAGCGTWSGQTGPKNIKHSDTGDIIGCTRMLSFQCSNKDSANKDLGHWIMHEYSLSDATLMMATGQANSDLVLCKITKCIKKASDHGHIQQPAATQFYFPVAGNGGSDNDVRSLATTGNINKRAGEEIEHQGCKKQKSCGEGFLDVEVEDWNIDLDNIDLDSLDFDLGSI